MKKYFSLFSVTAIFLLCVCLSGCCCISNVMDVQSPVPPAGAYGVSSIGTMDGDVQFYSSVTEEIMVIEKSGTGTFFFDGQEYYIAFEDGKLLVDGRSLIYQYMTSSPDEPMLLIYWSQDDTNTIILRPIAENVYYTF